jgi:two-component system, LytTR family, response regulator AlgR
MSALTILIVDDEAPARKRLADVLGDIAASVPNIVLGEAAHGMEALERAQQLKPALVLLDMQMPRMGGLETARHLSKLTPAPAVVFVTAHDEYAVEAFEVSALDYLMKPVRAERLTVALQKVVRQGQTDPRMADGALAVAQESMRAKVPDSARQHFSIAERGKITLVPVMDVLYLRAELKYVTLRTATREFLIEESLVHLEEEFADFFVRVHRNAMVARHAIVGFEKAPASDDGEQQWHVVLRGTPDRLAVSRRQWPHVKEFARG